MSTLIEDLLQHTRQRIEASGADSAASVRAQRVGVASFSSDMAAGIAALKGFLFRHMYRHPRVMEPVTKAKQVVRELFATLATEPALLPADWAAACGLPNDAVTASVVRDYIAGMTDRFALAEHAKITHTQISL